ncbi:16S rRNA (cytosine(1402)-N(4))-methyltransferase RsmH [Pseudactinotalea sp. Z1732]|uniref:16S rRNA (cytosine(1402)-N(4))-methyltransferase RsmH n=1 Tax=Micrococcales TaxID=85006 RepID=UPI003C7AE0FB
MISKPIGALHAPVLADRCAELLAPALDAPGALAVDATLGMGGHSEVLLRRHPGLRLIGIDRDQQALALAGQRLAAFGDRFEPVHAVYDQIPAVLAERSHGPVQGLLFDLGVSSLQLDRAERGFSYAQEAPLDMRMDQSAGRTAARLLAEEDEAGLRRILSDYGQERFAGRIAAAIVRRRRTEPLQRSGELVDLVRENIPQAARRTGGNPAKRTFQALRIAVNAELEVLRAALPGALQTLAVGGRMVVLSYHSLEDRMVKNAFRPGLTSSTPVDLPTELPGHEPYLRSLTRGSEAAGDAEQRANPRSASVRLRAVERLRPTPKHLQEGPA